MIFSEGGIRADQQTKQTLGFVMLPGLEQRPGQQIPRLKHFTRPWTRLDEVLEEPDRGAVLTGRDRPLRSDEGLAFEVRVRRRGDKDQRDERQQRGTSVPKLDPGVDSGQASGVR